MLQLPDWQMLQSPDMRSRKLRKRQLKPAQGVLQAQPHFLRSRVRPTRSPKRHCSWHKPQRREAEGKIWQLDNARKQLAKTNPDTQAWFDANQEVETLQGELNTALEKNENAWGPLLDEVNKTDPDRHSSASQYIEEQYAHARYLSLNYRGAPWTSVSQAEIETYASARHVLQLTLGREPSEKEVGEYLRTQASEREAKEKETQPSTDEVVERVLAQPVDTSRGAPKPAHVATKPAGKVASSAEVAKQDAKADQVAQQKLNAAHARFDAAKKKLNAMNKPSAATAQTKTEALKRADELKAATDAYVDAAVQAKTAARDTGDAGKIARAEKAYSDAMGQQSIALQDVWNVRQLYNE
jgi:hypothetical protein